MTQLDALLADIVADPREETRWLVLADWLAENDQPERAELLCLHRKLLATCCEPDAHPERAEWQARVVALLVAGVRPCVPQETLTLPDGVPLTFSFIPPGAFLMGGEQYEGDESEQLGHRVDLDYGFFLGVFPVTQAQWAAVMGTAPSLFPGANRPVEEVSWDDGQEFCTKMSQLTGRRCELPTEAEWEYACRSGTTSMFWSGSDEAVLNSVGFFNDNSDSQTEMVGQLAANPWGLFDVHGNVWEWCQDEPCGEGKWDEHPAKSNSRIIRGGSCHVKAHSCRASAGWWEDREYRHSDLGFRVCLRLD